MERFTLPGRDGLDAEGWICRPPAPVAMPVAVASARARHTRGLLLALGATTAWSSAGLFVRLVAA